MITRWRSFSEARKFAQSLKLVTRNDWRKYCKSGKRPSDIPYDPDLKYPNWTNWNDFLGSKKPTTKKEFLSFNEARKYVRKQNLKDFDDWRKWYKSDKRPKNIPANPLREYKKEFVSYPDWLGIDRIATKKMGELFVTYEEAKKFAKKIPPQTFKEWFEYIEKNSIPKNIPRDPQSFYKKQGTWKGWPDFFGTNRIANRDRVFWSYEKVKRFVAKLNLKSQTEWAKYSKTGKRPLEIPSNPQHHYSDQWEGWGEFLGTGNISPSEISKKTIPWKQAKKLYQKIAKENNLKNLNDWNEYVKTHQLPEGLPKSPKNIYTKVKVKKRSKKKER